MRIAPITGPELLAVPIHGDGIERIVAINPDEIDASLLVAHDGQRRSR